MEKVSPANTLDIHLSSVGHATCMLETKEELTCEKKKAIFPFSFNSTYNMQVSNMARKEKV